MTPGLRRAARVAAVVVAAMARIVLADDAARTVTVVVHDGRMRATLADAPLRQVVDEVARQTGADVHGDIPEDRHVSVTFDDVPLEEGLRRVLGDLSFALRYDDAGRLRTIDLHGGPQGTTRGPASLPALDAVGGPAADDTVRQASERLRAFAMSDRRIPIHGRLARALGTDQARFEDVAGATFNHDDAAVRAAARRVALRAIESDPDAREAITTLVTSLPDVALTEVVHGMAKDHALEFADGVARDAHTPALRNAAQTVATAIRDEDAVRR